MFEDFSFCTECDYYDRNDRLCKLYQCVRANGCQCGVERKPRNNYERLKAMSMEEMAIWLDLVRNNKDYPIYATDWEEWLKEACREQS